MALAVQKYFEYKIKQITVATSHLAISQQLLQVYQNWRLKKQTQSTTKSSCIATQNAQRVVSWIKTWLDLHRQLLSA